MYARYLCVHAKKKKLSINKMKKKITFKYQKFKIQPTKTAKSKHIEKNFSFSLFKYQTPFPIK